ncbi:LuxR C-terminal-related transcriptional regulator [Thalassobellus citreus]|uniref:LuxR C-terminal-related transcriptional regulator n=1 Tax=Thalassobellus citreus TaxID=3367752 RepID=UPI00379DCF7E
MKKESINKLLKVWKTKNLILKPVEKQDIINIIDHIASIFAADSFYYLIMNFETMSIEYVSEGTKTVLGINPEALTLEKIFSLMHPEDLEKMHEKETTSLNFKLNKIPKEDITKYKTVYLMRLKDASGNYKTILHQAKALNISNDGKVFQVLSIHTDITNLNPSIDHKISFISNECPSYYSLETGKNFSLAENSFKNLFTNREKEIIHLVAQGKQTKDIALLLFISTQTVNSHKKNILRKSHCKNTAELITTCIREGVI